MNSQYYVYDVDNNKITTPGIYDTYDAALTQAKSLVVKEGRKFEVLSLVAACAPPDVDSVIVTKANGSVDQAA